MIRKLLIRDLTLRDGQQSAFATRMSQKQIDKVLPFYREAGFYAMEIWGGAVPDSINAIFGRRSLGAVGENKSFGREYL